MRMVDKRLSARWVFDCFSWQPSFSELTVAFSSIQIEEKERIGKFVFQNDAKRSLIGRLLMRKFICDSSGLPWDEVKLERDSNGKPCLSSVHSPSLSFNVSHHGRYVALAGDTGSRLLGIDIMEMKYKGGKPLPEFFRLMNRNFSHHEWQTINDSPDETVREKLFFRHWCLKESYVKATGTGISVDLRDISFKLKSKTLRIGQYVQDTVLYLDGQEQMQWEFQESLIDNDYCVCVAIIHAGGKPQVKPKSFSFISIDELLDDCKPILSVDGDFCNSFLKKE